MPFLLHHTCGIFSSDVDVYFSPFTYTCLWFVGLDMIFVSNFYERLTSNSLKPRYARSQTHIARTDWSCSVFISNNNFDPRTGPMCRYRRRSDCCERRMRGKPAKKARRTKSAKYIFEPDVYHWSFSLSLSLSSLWCAHVARIRMYSWHGMSTYDFNANFFIYYKYFKVVPFAVLTSFQGFQIVIEHVFNMEIINYCCDWSEDSAHLIGREEDRQMKKCTANCMQCYVDSFYM